MSRAAPLGGPDAAYAARQPIEALRRPHEAVAAVPGAEAFDPVAALLETSDTSPPHADGLAGRLMDYVMPRPRQPDTLQPQRLGPLLGLAAHLLAGQASGDADLLRLGAAAIEHELRRHQTLAERRAAPIMDDAA